MGWFREMRALRRQGREALSASGHRPGLRGLGDLMSTASSTMATASADAAVLEHGRPAAASVIAARETGMVVNHRHVVELDLEVRGADLAPYRATVTTSVAMTTAAFAVPGAALAVKVDPADPSQVAVDWAATTAHPEPG